MTHDEAELQGAAISYVELLRRFDTGQYSENEVRAFRDVRNRLIAAASKVERVPV